MSAYLIAFAFVGELHSSSIRMDWSVWLAKAISQQFQEHNPSVCLASLHSICAVADLQIPLGS